MSETKQIAKNTFIQILGKAISTIFGLITVAFLARILGPEGYGQFTIALGFLTIFATLVDFGLTLTTTQMISEKNANESKILSAIISLRALSAFFFLSLAPIIALFFPYDQIIITAIAIGALSYFFASGSQVMMGVFQKNLDMVKPILAEVINRSAVLFGALILAQTSAGLISIMWLFVLGNILHLLTIIIGAKKYSTFQFSFDTQLWRQIISRTWPIGASIFFNLIYLKGDIIFLSLYRDDIEIGYYGMAYKVIEVIASVPVMYMGLILPILVASWTSKNQAKFNDFIQRAFDFFTIFSLPVAIGSALTGTEIINFIAGPEYAPAGPVLYFLGPTLIFVFLGALYGHAVVGLNKQKPMTLAYLFVAVITIIGYLIHIPIYGMYGAAFWTLFSEALITLLAFLVVHHYTKYFPNLKTTFRAILATFAMSIIILTLPEIHILITILISATTYIITLAFLGGPTYKDLLNLFAPEKPPIVQG